RDALWSFRVARRRVFDAFPVVENNHRVANVESAPSIASATKFPSGAIQLDCFKRSSSSDDSFPWRRSCQPLWKCGCCARVCRVVEEPMLNSKKIVVVMPAYNAARTLRRTHDEVMAHGIVDHVIIVDDGSDDETVAIARTLPDVQVEVHPENRGYGANQKTCYRLALDAGADIIIMIHPDYQYTPQLIPAMAALVASGLYPCVLASRILGGGALRGGMPWWKYISNRFLTFVENLLIGAKLSEYHTGYRAFSRRLLERLPLEQNSNDFVFDNQILAQIIALGCAIGEVTCPDRYMPEASSINFRRSVRYGLGCMAT